MVQERRIMEGNQNLCLIFCCVFGNNSLEEFDSRGRKIIAVTFSTSIMLTRGPSCCGNFAEEEK
jgi:hypothetical protein